MGWQKEEDYEQGIFIKIPFSAQRRIEEIAPTEEEKTALLMGAIAIYEKLQLNANFKSGIITRTISKFFNR